MTICVLGEALIDFMPRPDGSYVPRLGGSMFNLAISLGRQGVSTNYLSPLSTDNMGQRLRQALLDAEVFLAEEAVSPMPTSLAMVSLDSSGVPSYSLYREAVADRDWAIDEVKDRMPEDCQLLHSGSLAITPEDVPRVAELFRYARSLGILISVDINIRMSVATDQDTYLKGIESLLPLCDLVKVSDEDLAWFGYDEDVIKASEVLQGKMAGDLIALTLGAEGAWLLTPEHRIYHTGFKLGEVVDTVGAGDTFYSALLSVFDKKNILKKETFDSCEKQIYRYCLEYACCAAAINVTREGCQPPYAREVEQVLST